MLYEIKLKYFSIIFYTTIIVFINILSDPLYF